MTQKEFIDTLKYFGFKTNMDMKLWRKGGVWIYVRSTYWVMSKPIQRDRVSYKETDRSLITAQLRKMINPW